MKHSKLISSFFPFLIASLFSTFSLVASKYNNNERFLQCHFPKQSNTITSGVIYTPNEPSYIPLLNSTIMNSRFAVSPSTPKPLAIITPSNASEVQAAIFCSKKHGIQIRTRSGGHDGEGLSYLSHVPYVIIDLRNLHSVEVDVEKKTAWVQAGATLGEVYYRISEKSANLGFPAGICYTVGVGGHFSGGGYGPLVRKYGLSADNILDAHIVDAKGRFLNRTSMGEDLFWAIRGGGAASFGIVLAWKIQLVLVPSKVTVFNVVRDLEKPETKKLVHKWQYVAEKLPEDIMLFVLIQAVKSTTTEYNSTKPVVIQATFTSLYLGEVDNLLHLMQKSFPELGLAKEDCIETSWIESILLLLGFQAGTPPNVLLDRTKPQGRPASIIEKVDFVQEPVPEEALQRVWDRLYEEDGAASILLYPLGGRMSEISESEIPFPHRAGNLYELTYLARWTNKEHENVEATSKRHLNWVRSIIAFMTPYVSKNPRRAYLNSRDLDLGRNNDVGPISYAQASTWGRRYFKNNFDKLVHVKTKVDSINFFRNEQSIPPLLLG